MIVLVTREEMIRQASIGIKHLEAIELSTAGKLRRRDYTRTCQQGKHDPDKVLGSV